MKNGRHDDEDEIRSYYKGYYGEEDDSLEDETDPGPIDGQIDLFNSTQHEETEEQEIEVETANTLDENAEKPEEVEAAEEEEQDDLEETEDKEEEPAEEAETEASEEEVEEETSEEEEAENAEEELEDEETEEDEEESEESGDGEDDNGEEETGCIAKPLEQMIHESMMPYSEFVILDRALPRVEDGLKPVQRRVLYSMLEVGVTPDKSYRKSAKIVGDCMGNYHPHGDKSIYDTMVRMAQDFNMRERLIDGHGNYGSVDGDGAAAMRYTEAKLTPMAMELLKDIEKDTVSWSFNFDDTRKEPDMLPGRFPNLLINGSTGIAVGLATNIPPHNPVEAINAVIAYINNPKITLQELMEIMPAPDFPTGGYILKASETEQAYETGRGKIMLRAKIHIEDAGNGKSSIVITEFPYQVNKASCLQKIARLKEDDETGILSSIIDIIDESDRSGTRAVIKLKKDANLKKILRILYKSSDLQINFNVNMVAIANGKPKQLSLLEILEYYVNYQQQVVFNRTKFDLEVCEKRAHVLEGLLIAIHNIDDVIRIIKTSKSTPEAKERLRETFHLSEVQAQAILEMRLARLTNLEVNKLTSELEELKELIIKYGDILKSKRLQMNVVKTELVEIRDKFGTMRQTQIIAEEEDVVSLNDADDDNGSISLSSETVNVIYTANKTLKAVPEKAYKQSDKNFTENSTENEISVTNLVTGQDKFIYIFTNVGNCHKILTKTIPVTKYKERGANLNTLIKNYADNETVVEIFAFDETNEKDDLVFITKTGMIKLTKQNEYYGQKQTIQAIKLREGDELLYVGVNSPNKNVLLFTRDGMAVNVPKDDIALCARVSMGVKGIQLSGSDYVVGGFEETEGGAYALFTNLGQAKVLKRSDIPGMMRNRKGVKAIDPKKKGLQLIGAFPLSKKESYVVKTDKDGLAFVLNKKIVLDELKGRGRSVISKINGSKAKEVFKYVVQ